MIQYTEYSLGFDLSHTKKYLSESISSSNLPAASAFYSSFLCICYASCSWNVFALILFTRHLTVCWCWKEHLVCEGVVPMHIYTWYISSGSKFIREKLYRCRFLTWLVQASPNCMFLPLQSVDKTCYKERNCSDQTSHSSRVKHKTFR